jgi:outer membrane receptor protein involved in Fe transport
MIAGLRAEYYEQRHTGRDQRYASGDTKNGRNLVNEKVLGSLDLFPSLNLIYSFTETINLRTSYTRTIARPSFKELSFAQILDPVSNRIFNGSLFTYGAWDGKLTETRIDNIDLRWELFGERDQIYSVSLFFKKFDDPIELVRIPEQQTSTEYQPRNVGDGRLYGIELEFRKELGFISPYLDLFSLNGNITLVRSEIDMTETEYNSRKSFEKTGETISDTREMAGQSPWVINAGINYIHPETGIQTGIYYNVKGQTLAIVGAGLFPDVYAEPFHSLNFSFNLPVGKKERTGIDFRISNILNDKNEYLYHSFRADPQIYSSYNLGRTFSLGVSVRI